MRAPGRSALSVPPNRVSDTTQGSALTLAYTDAHVHLSNRQSDRGRSFGRADILEDGTFSSWSNYFINLNLSAVRYEKVRYLDKKKMSS